MNTLYLEFPASTNYHLYLENWHPNFKPEVVGSLTLFFYGSLLLYWNIDGFKTF